MFRIKRKTRPFFNASLFKTTQSVHLLKTKGSNINPIPLFYNNDSSRTVFPSLHLQIKMVNRTACSLFSTCGWMLFTASTEHYPVYYPGALANKNTDLQLFFRGRLTVLFYCAISIWLVGSQLLFLSPFVFFQKWFFSGDLSELCVQATEGS